MACFLRALTNFAAITAIQKWFSNTHTPVKRWLRRKNVPLSFLGLLNIDLSDKNLTGL